MKSFIRDAAGVFVAFTLNLWAGDLAFEETLIEMVAEPDQEQITALFSFTVKDGEARIKRYDAPCSCLEAQISDGGKLAWKEGESGTVKGIFRVGKFRGTVDKGISIIMTNGKRHDLTVRMTMPELVQIEPKTLKWHQGDETETKTFEISVNHTEPIRITDISGTNEETFPYELVTLEEGARYQIKVTPSGLDTRGFGLLRIKTDSHFKKHQAYQAYVVVTKPAVAEFGPAR